MNQAGHPVYFINHSEFITGKCKKILSRVNKIDIPVDDYAKDGGQRRPDIYVVFIKLLCGRNICVW